VTLRTGLIGTGPWARLTHGPALTAVDGTTFAAVWGRDRQKTEGFVRELSREAETVVAFDDIDAFLDAVDVVVFAVPPDIQQGIAIRAAGLGKHLLLEKPIARDLAAGLEVVGAIEDAGIAASVFFTQQHLPTYTAWRDELVRTGGWRSARFERFAPVLTDPEGLFFGSAWRHELGGWWDGAPHAIAHLMTVLGPVTAVQAARGPGDLTDAILWHESGARSTIAISFDATVAVPGVGWLLGEQGKVDEPTPEGWAGSSVEASRNAVAGIVATVERGAAPNPADVRFGYRVLQVVDAGDRSIAEARRIEVTAEA
jgi:predicted dehydrogenase